MKHALKLDLCELDLTNFHQKKLRRIQLFAPLSKDEKTCVEINLSDFDLIKILGNFLKNIFVVFIKPSLKFAKQIKDQLGKEDFEKGPYFDP